MVVTSRNVWAELVAWNHLVYFKKKHQMFILVILAGHLYSLYISWKFLIFKLMKVRQLKLL